ncbi:uncharacterized protein KIAA1755 homolog isoform X2 [Rhea pennata]|uniref:uncharacterized protein KIAA1755 homolog isoform X2 n=1 Tax=Rhea pennata TaxID=8795 RepID=UPI002E26C41E
MDARSLDAAVQSALRALYPPFEATAPTVLGQVFRLLETSYRGDGLCCLLDFLIPAKRLFEHVRQAACAPYFNCIFLHEGWPLCLREKVVVHLAPLNPLLLRSGDFYLQAEPCAGRAARLTVKHLSRDLRTVRETPVPEATYALLFTNEWLEEINCEHDGAPLHTCLVATEDGVAPLPWSSIATPEFVDGAGAGPGCAAGAAGAAGAAAGTSSPAAAPSRRAAAEPAPPGAPGPLCTADAPRPYGNVAGPVPGCKDASQRSGQGKYPGLIKVAQLGPRKKPATLVVPSLREIVSQNLEGEYVDLLELSEEKLDLLARSLPGPGGRGGLAPGSGAACPPCRGSGHLAGEPCCYGSRCRHRDSYLAALQNPVSFGAGLMAAIREEPDGPGPAPPPAAGGSPVLRSRAAAAAAAAAGDPGAEAEDAAKQGNLKLLKSPARAEVTGSGHKFSFLKGQRHGAAPGDGSAAARAASHPQAPWKKMSAIYSPRMSRAKLAGKGPDPAAGASADDGAPPGASGRSAPGAGRERGAPRPPAWQELHAGLLRSGVVRLPGSTDKLGHAIIQVTTSSTAWEAAWCSASELARLVLYLCSLPRKEAKDGGLTVVVDARKQPPPPVLFAALRSVQSAAPGSVRAVLLLAEKELPGPREKLPGVQVETLPSLKALGRYVDSSQVTPDLDGTFPYRHSESCSPSRPACGRRRSCCGAASGSCAQPTAPRGCRSSLEAAEELYSQLEEEVHDLVSKSNSCLERLEFLRKTTELQAEFSELGRWLDGEAAARLEEMGAQECSPGGIEKSFEQFKEFLTQAAARYSRGLALCQEAAELQDSVFPEADPFQAAAALFRTKLTSFHAATERRRAELEMLRELCSFSSEIAWLNLDCKRCSGSAKRGESQAGNLEALQGLESSFQKLSVDLSLEKLQEMKAHVRAMQSSHGPAAWTAARQRYRESRRILEEMLAELRQAWGAGGKGDVSGPSRPGSAAPGQAAPGCEAASSPAPGSRRAEGQDTRAGRPPTGASLLKPAGGACARPGGSVAQDVGRLPPLALAPAPRCAARPCPPASSKPPARGVAAAPHARPPPAEAAQYFQVSSRSSLSSDDSDSHASAEELPAARGAAPPCPSVEPPHVEYLEKPLAGGPAEAAAE